MRIQKQQAVEEAIIRKPELATTTTGEADLVEEQANRALSALLDEITDALNHKNSVTLVGLDIFLQHHREARTGESLQTGQLMKIKANNTVALKLGKALHDMVNRSSRTRSQSGSGLHRRRFRAHRKDSCSPPREQPQYAVRPPGYRGACMKFHLPLWVLGRLMAKASHDDPTLRKQLEGKDLTFQLHTPDDEVMRHYLVRNLRVSSKCGTHPQPAFSLGLRDGAYGFVVMTSKNPQLAFMQGIQNKGIQIQGSPALVIWFQGLMKYLKPKEKTPEKRAI